MFAATKLAMLSNRSSNYFEAFVVKLDGQWSIGARASDICSGELGTIISPAIITFKDGRSSNSH
jgi:hypothetical protein